MTFSRILSWIRARLVAGSATAWLSVLPAVFLPVAAVLQFQWWQRHGTILSQSVGLAAFFITVGAGLGLLIEVYRRQQRATEVLASTALWRHRRLEELLAFTASLVGTLDPRRVYDAVTERAARVLATDAASFVLADGAEVVYQARFGPGEFTPGFRRLAEDSLAGTVVREGRAIRIADTERDPRCRSWLEMETPTRALLAVPVVVDGVAVGSLGALQYTPRQFTKDEEELLGQLAAIAASVLHTATAFGVMHRQLDETAELRTLAAAVKAMRDGVILVDGEGVIRFVNEAAVKIHGYESAGELVGKRVDVLVPEEHAADFAALLPVMRSAGWAGEAMARHQSGRLFPVQVAVAPMPLGDSAVGAVGVIADLTERRQLEQRAVVAEKLATLGRLVAGAAHEINNPLSAVSANAELALQAMAATDPARPPLEVIAAEARRAGQIVKDLLSFARQRPVTKRTFDVRESVRDVLRLRRKYHQSRGIDVVAELPAEDVCVLGDSGQLKQVLLNLVVNAEYALRETAAPRMRVSVVSSGSLCRIAVEDSGPGVPEALRGQVFEPFFTTKPEGEGTGLGLSVSYGIVREHGGHIWVEDSDLGGARFVVELPAAPAAGRQATSPLRAGEQPSGKRVLLVDDEEQIRSAVQRMLRRHGHEVDVAADGHAALALVDASSYDVIFCDIRMPNLSGPELYAELERRGIVPASRFVVTTGDIADPDTERFLGAAQVPVLLKPFELQSLLTALAA